jgi:hypothetical protein
MQWLQKKVTDPHRIAMLQFPTAALTAARARAHRRSHSVPRTPICPTRSTQWCPLRPTRPPCSRCRYTTVWRGPTSASSCPSSRGNGAVRSLNGTCWARSESMRRSRRDQQPGSPGQCAARLTPRPTHAAQRSPPRPRRTIKAAILCPPEFPIWLGPRGKEQGAGWLRLTAWDPGKNASDEGAARAVVETASVAPNRCWLVRVVSQTRRRERGGGWGVRSACPCSTRLDWTRVRSGQVRSVRTGAHPSGTAWTRARAPPPRSSSWCPHSLPSFFR